ncbi:MAG: glycosyltransferase family 39 protein [Pseudomonadota bacterium]
MKYVIQIGALCLISCFTIFSNRGLLNPDVMEARNIVSAREMVKYNNWLIPTLNGEVRIAKPPLPTWVTSLAVFGCGSDDNLEVLRLPAGIAALLMVLFVYGISFRLTDDPRIPFLSAAVLASTALLMFMGRNAAWDIFCHMFMAGAIWALFWGWEKGKGGAGVFILSGLFMGLSFMSKGPVSFHSMLLPFLLSYLFAFGYKNIVSRWKEILLAVFVCLITSGLWPLYIYLHLPVESIATAYREAGAWFPSHTKPFWDYLQFPALSGIWIFFILPVLVWPYAREKVDSFGTNYIFLFTWMVLTLLLLSAIPKKSTHYLLPVLVPMSLLIGFYVRYLMAAFEQRRQTPGDTIILTTHVAVISLISFCIPGLFYYYGLRPWHLSLMRFTLYFILFAGMGVGLIQFHKDKKVFQIALVSIAILSLSCLLVPPTVGHGMPQRSFMALKEIRNRPEIEQLELYSLPKMDSKEIWAAGRRVREIGTGTMALRSLNFPVALFSKTHPDHLRQNREWDNLKIHLLDVLGDKTKNETWYLSIVDKE